MKDLKDLKDYNFQNENNLNNKNNYDDYDKYNKRNNNIFDNVIYIIMIATMIMCCPLIYKLANNYSRSNISASNDREDSSEWFSKNRKYVFTEKQIDISVLKDTEYGDLNLNFMIVFQGILTVYLKN